MRLTWKDEIEAYKAKLEAWWLAYTGQKPEPEPGLRPLNPRRKPRRPSARAREHALIPAALRQALSAEKRK